MVEKNTLRSEKVEALYCWLLEQCLQRRIIGCFVHAVKLLKSLRSKTKGINDKQTPSLALLAPHDCILYSHQFSVELALFAN